MLTVTAFSFLPIHGQGDNADRGRSAPLGLKNFRHTEAGRRALRTAPARGVAVADGYGLVCKTASRQHHPQGFATKTSLAAWEPKPKSRNWATTPSASPVKARPAMGPTANRLSYEISFNRALA